VWRYRPLFDFVNLEDDSHPAYRVRPPTSSTPKREPAWCTPAVMYGRTITTRHAFGAARKAHGRREGRFNDAFRNGRDGTSRIRNSSRIGGLPETTEPVLSSGTVRTRLSPLLAMRIAASVLRTKVLVLKTTAVRDRLLSNNRIIRWFPRDVGRPFRSMAREQCRWALSRTVTGARR